LLSARHTSQMRKVC